MSQNRAILESSGQPNGDGGTGAPTGAPRRKGRKQMADRKAERQARRADRKRKRERARLERYVNALLREGVPFTIVHPDTPVSTDTPSATVGPPPKPAREDQANPENQQSRSGFPYEQNPASIRDTDKSTLYEKGKPMANDTPRRGSPKQSGHQQEQGHREFSEPRGTQVVPIVPVDDKNVPSAIVGPPLENSSSSDNSSSDK